MSIPEKLQEAIQNEIDRFGWNAITEARKDLTDRYRHQPHKKRQFMEKEEHRSAYVAARMPATYSAVHRVLEELPIRLPGIQINSLLDLGAGPGTVMWAASDLFPDLKQMTLIEKDANLASLGKRLATSNDHPSVKSAQWLIQDLEQVSNLSLSQYDLITLSYSIGELSEKTIPLLIEACWKATNQCLVIIEPGTPVGFERIRAIRRQLIDLQAYIVAPCPHALACPMMDGDWCHFSERVERSSLHRRLKEGTLGYEDEKFSYIAVSKSPAHLPQTRVLRHPMKKSGHVNLTLCTPEGLKHETVSKKADEAYKEAKKVEWGSAYPSDKKSKHHTFEQEEGYVEIDD